MISKSHFLCIALFFFLAMAYAQKEDLTGTWPSSWIEPASGSVMDYSVSYYRKSFTMDKLPDTLMVHTSGDTRYQLFVNGKQVTWGPQTGDIRHWYYESTDIRPYLKTGKNVIAASVHNYGSHPPDARVSVQTGFILAADNQQYRFLNTPNQWKAKVNPAYSPIRVSHDQVRGYYGGGSREMVDANLFIWGWENPDFDDAHWEEARVTERAYAKNHKWASRWKLTPRTLPFETITTQRFESVRDSGSAIIDPAFPRNKGSITIPPQTTTRIILDQGVLTTAYPIFIFNKGKDAQVKITYSEAAYENTDKGNEKGNRNEIEGKVFTGYFDQYTADGGNNRTYRPFWWRTFRYMVLDITTKNEILEISDLYSEESTYPFSVATSFQVDFTEKSNDTPPVDRIIETGIRTSMLCAHETFIDCPYYEESQFQGDARIQALVSYMNFNDPRLGKNAIEQFSWSVNEEGFLSARYPTNSYYYIPNYSLYWIGMLYDYLMFVGDEEYIASKLKVSRYLINYFVERQRDDGTIKKPAYHNFVDWSFYHGEAPSDENGYAALMDLHFLLALQWAETLERTVGEETYALEYAKMAENLKEQIKTLYWNDAEGLFSDTPKSNVFSQHTNCLAILTEVVEGENARKIFEKVLSDNRLTQATLYWSFYVFETMKKCEMGDIYTQHLGIWEDFLKKGVTTWPETPDPSRSECHGWGSSPNYHFFTIMAGIRPLSPGFEKVEIAPAMGEARKVDATVPHPKGEIVVAIEKAEKGCKAAINLPEHTSGVFIWEGDTIEIHAGENKINLPE